MQRGQSLFEVVLAIGISAIIIIALVALTSSAIRNATFSKNKTLSTHLSQEATEWLRSQRDADWQTFINNIASPCTIPPHTQCLLNPPSWGNCAGSGGSCTDKIDNVFERKVSFSCKEISEANPEGSWKLCNDPSVNAVETLVVVSWEDAQGVHEAKSSTILTSW
jgi:Tfp pilus assembly protein PilV